MIFRVRQRLVYFEDFVVDTDTAEHAIDAVNRADVINSSSTYVETTATYLMDEDGEYMLPTIKQPPNAVLPEV